MTESSAMLEALGDWNECVADYSFQNHAEPARSEVARLGDQMCVSLYTVMASCLSKLETWDARLHSQIGPKCLN